jgi:squalene-hopene/tetraprenyl-beta-curcumene cyclase
LNPGGTTLVGTWTWGKQPATLKLQRVPNEAAWHTPMNYQYHHKDVTYTRPSPDEPKIPFAPRLAVDYMEQGALAWTGERQCIACHTNGTYMMVRPLMMPELGVPQQAMHDFWVAELKTALGADPKQRNGIFDGTEAVYLAAGLAIWDAHVLHHLSSETVQALDLMWQFQRPAGDWYIEDDNNPPFESSPYQVATVAARAVANAPGWLGQQRGTAAASHVELLKRYLRTPQKMQGDYDRTDLLWTASEYPGLLDVRQERELIAMIFAHQQFDGGWSMRSFVLPEQWGKGNRAAKLRSELEFGFPQSDGHMTGLAIIALRKAGVPSSDPRIQSGIQWLLSNQRSSGRWWTRSLNRDGWQFISYSGTAYPMLALALCNALPKA